jgi:hypothetical protein
MPPRGEPAFDDFKTFVADFGELDELFILVDGPRRRAKRWPTRSRPACALDTITGVQGRIDTAAAADTLLDRSSSITSRSPTTPGARTLTPRESRRWSSADKLMLAAVRRQPGAHRHRGSARLPPHRRPQPRQRRRRRVARSRRRYITAHDGQALLLLAPRGLPFDAVFTSRMLDQVDAAIAARAAVPDAACACR